MSCSSRSCARRWPSAAPQPEDLLVSFNPELAPQYMLFEQAAAIENLPPAERQQC